MAKRKARKIRHDPGSARRAELERTRRAPWERGERGERGDGGDGGDGPKALQFTQLNWALLGIAGVVIMGGYLALASTPPFVSTVVAPILLVAGYGVLIPLGLIL